MAEINLLSAEEKTPPQPQVQRVTQLIIPAGTIQPRHLQANYFMVKIGLAADRPTDGTSTRFYFATDTYVMSYYDTAKKVWKSGSAFT